MICTKHGHTRVKGRIGLPKRAHTRHIHKVLKNGKLLSRKGLESFKVVYLEFLYIFSLTDTLEPIFITTYKVKNI